MKDISEITLQLKESEEKVSIHYPLKQKKQREIHQSSPHIQLQTYLLSLLYKRFAFLVPARRRSNESKLKTVLAYLLRQEKMRSYLLEHQKRKSVFLKIIKETAFEMNVTLPRIPEDLPNQEIARSLTYLKNGSSLFENDQEYHLQHSILPTEEHNKILYQLLGRIEREPIESTLEAVHAKGIDKIQLITKYMKYKIFGIQQGGKILYDRVEDQTTSSIRTKENILQGEKGAINQRFAYDADDLTKIGFYCGELTSSFNVLEQILLILAHPHDEVELLEQQSADEEKRILFTSLYAWSELELIAKQREAIQSLNGKILKVGSKTYALNLLYYNISFSMWNRLPTPAETGAVMNDYNDETMISLTTYAFQKLGLPSGDLETLALQIKEKSSDFIERQRKALAAVDAFRALHPWLISSLMQVIGQVELVTTLLALLTNKRPDGKSLKGIDKLLYLDLLAKHLDFAHSKNCQNATSRSAGAKAADKAQTVFQKIHSTPFMPGKHTDGEKQLFESLYSLYLLWEEPEINALLSTGSDKKYTQFLYKNPETTRYLTLL